MRTLSYILSVKTTKNISLYSLYYFAFTVSV